MNFNPIETLEYSLTKTEYFKILIENRLRRYWYLYLMIVGGGLFLLTNSADNPLFILIAFASFIYVLGIFIYLYYWAYSDKNKILFLKRKLGVNENGITVSTESGSRGEIPFGYLLNVVERKNYWLLYIALGQFVYVPKEAFKNHADFAGFREILKTKAKTK